MMELLAGPYIVDHADPDNRNTAPAGVNRAFWDDELGIGSLGAYTSVSDVFGHYSNYFVVQLDGTAGARAKAEHGAVLVDMSGEYEWALFTSGFDPVLGSSGSVYGFDKQSGVYADKVIARMPELYAYPTSFPQIRMAERLIAIQGPYVNKVALDGSDPGWSVECVFTPFLLDPIYSGGGAVPTVSRTKEKDVLCLIYPSGAILFYNVATRQQVIKPWIARIGANSGAWYSVKYDVYISYTVTDTDWFLSIWANAVRPDSLSNPEAVTPAVSGKVTQIRVRVLGAHGEPCAGELITWAITAGDGSLTTPQSKTDDDGYAYTGYVAPITVTTAPTIQAEVEF